MGLVKQLRRALNDRDTEAPLIRTAHGVGYAFVGTLGGRVSHAPTISRWVVVASARVALAEGDNIIGRDALAVVRLDAAGVSRRHACIVVDGAVATLHDVGSKNGTFVNDLLLSGSVVLKDGDRIQAGPAVLIYHASTSGVSTETVIPLKS